MKITEHKGEAETTPWTTDTQKEHPRRVKGVSTLAGLPLPQAGSGLNGEDSSGPRVSLVGGECKVDIQLSQHCGSLARNPSWVASHRDCVGGILQG